MTPTENDKLYQVRYAEGFTTELPDRAVLQQLLATDFKGSSKDYTVYLDVLRALGVCAKAKLYDFGCSWGYGTYQLAKAGFDVEGYEISRPRARFAANELGIRLCDPEAVPDNSLDVFFSAHVLEHVRSVEAVLKLADRLLCAGGWFIAFTPNGSLERRRRDPIGWHRAWGFVHPQLLDREWIDAQAAKFTVVADTDPYDFDAIRERRKTESWGGSELLFGYRKLTTPCSHSKSLSI